MSVYRQWLADLRRREDLDSSAFLSCDRSHIVIAGPGSGKTRLLVMKAAQLLEQEIAAPQGLACLTFSRKLAREIEERLWRLGIRSTANVFLGTLHGFCLSAVAQPFAQMFDLGFPDPFRIASEKKCLVAFRKARYAEGIRCHRSEFNLYRKTAYLDLRLGFDVPDSCRKGGMEKAIRRYEHLLYHDPDEPAIDFEMLVRASIRLIRDYELVRDAIAARFPWILVDEYQDLGVALHRLVTTLGNETQIKIFAIGDPEQCIYQFRGANPKYLMQLANELPDAELTELSNNYRSARAVIEMSEVVLNDKRNQGLQVPQCGYCSVIKCQSLTDQCMVVVKLVRELIKQELDAGRITILGRKRDLGLQVSKAMRGIPHRLLAHPSYNTYTHLVSWLEEAATWCSVGWRDGSIQFEGVFKDWLRIYLCDCQTITAEESFAIRVWLFRTLSALRNPELTMDNWLTSVEQGMKIDSLLQEKLRRFRPDDVDHYERIKELVAPGGDLESLTVGSFGGSIPLPGEVRIDTIHGSKGSENDVVIIVGVEQLSVEDRSLLYVATTRARLAVLLLYSGHSGYCDELVAQINGLGHLESKQVTTDTSSGIYGRLVRALENNRR